MSTNAFGFDVDQFQKMFKFDEAMKMFQDVKFPTVEPQAVIDAQKKNVEALIAANKTAAAGYQDLYAKQVKLVEDGVAVMRSSLTEMGENAATVEGQQKNVKLASDAFEKAMTDMTDLAEQARKTQEDAFKIVQDRMKEALDELKVLAPSA
jgi:phasin family protein